MKIYGKGFAYTDDSMPIFVGLKQKQSQAQLEQECKKVSIVGSNNAEWTESQDSV